MNMTILSADELLEREAMFLETESQTRKYKRKLRRQRQISLDNKEIHTKKSGDRVLFNDADEQYEAYKRFGIAVIE